MSPQRKKATCRGGACGFDSRAHHVKTKELIRQLREADPSGELQCNVNGIDILYVVPKEGYWDGPHEILHLDEDGSCRVAYAETSTKGTKVDLRTWSIEDEIYANPDVPIVCSYDYVDTKREKDFFEWAKRTREAAKALTLQVRKEFFLKYVDKQAPYVTQDVASAFFDAHYSKEPRLPVGLEEGTVILDKGEEKDIRKLSSVERWHLLWDREIQITGTWLNIKRPQGVQGAKDVEDAEEKVAEGTKKPEA